LLKVAELLVAQRGLPGELEAAVQSIERGGGADVIRNYDQAGRRFSWPRHLAAAVKADLARCDPPVRPPVNRPACAEPHCEGGWIFIEGTNLVKACIACNAEMAHRNAL
jgi:hypothetical protein